MALSGRNRTGSSLNLDTTVVGLQDTPISNTPPIGGQVLLFDGTLWTPTAPASVPSDFPFLPVSGGDMEGPLNLAGDATTSLEPVTLQQMQAAIAALPAVPASVAEMPIVFFFPGKPTGGQIIRIPIAVAITIANLFAGSQFSVGTNPTASAVFNVLSNGTSFGTATISTAGAVTWTGGAWALNPGDVLEVEAPTTQDSTLADVAFTILALRV